MVSGDRFAAEPMTADPTAAVGQFGGERGVATVNVPFAQQRWQQ